VDRLALGLLALFVTRAALLFAGSFLLKCTGERIVSDLRVRLYAHLHTLGFKYFAGQRVGDLSSRLNNDVASVRMAMTDTFATCVVQGVMLAGSVVVMVALNARLGALVLTAVPLATLAARGFQRPLRLLSHRVQHLLGVAAATAEQGLSSARVVAAFARESFEVARYRAATEQVFDTSRRHTRLAAFVSSVVDLLFSLVLVAIFWYGGAEVLAGRLTAGEVVAFLFYALAITQGVVALAGASAALATAAGASARIFELLDTRADVTDAPRATPLRSQGGAVRFDGVTFGYTPDAPILGDVSFCVRSGETVALVGRSGAGKSTLLHLIPRFLDPTHGRVLVDGRDVRTVQLRSLREQIAVVTQEVRLFAGSIRENIRYGRLSASAAEIEAAARVANADGFIRDLPGGYDTQVGEYGVKLSGGQRQRIAIARALVKDAPILLLDEATSSLDAESEMLIQEALARLTRDRTTLVVAHRLATVQRADRIIVLDRGSVAESGTHEELMTHGGLYARLVAHQRRQAGAGQRPGDHKQARVARAVRRPSARLGRRDHQYGSVLAPGGGQPGLE